MNPDPRHARQRPGRPLVVSLILTAACLAGPPGCGSDPRRTMSDAELAQWSADDGARSAASFRDAIDRLLSRAESKSESAGAGQSVLDILALSGGGDFGAFGAGFLVGWGEVQDPAWRRPDFDVVSGVSTGALLAPFAFVNTDESCRTVEEFYRNPKKDWVRDRGLLFFLPSNPSFMAIKGLERDVRSAINDPFIEQMAARSREGRVLVVSATDLDLGRRKLWSVGAEAEAAAAGGDPERVSRILLASAAIPAVFPPVEIDGGIYADGGVTSNVLVKLEPRNPDGFLARWRAAHPDKPFPRVRYWIVFNNQTRQAPKTVQPRWPSVMSPALTTAVRYATLAEIRWLAAEADYTNSVWGTDIEVRVVSIPDDWRPPVEGDFQKETMASLTDLGRKLGADPKSWTVWTTSDHTAEGVRGQPSK